MRLAGRDDSDVLGDVGGGGVIKLGRDHPVGGCTSHDVGLVRGGGLPLLLPDRVF